MFAGWDTIDFVVTGVLFWFVGVPVAVFGGLAFFRDLERRYGPQAKVYDFTTEARKRKGRAA